MYFIFNNSSTKSIHDAVKNGQYTEVKRWIQEDKKLVNDLNNDPSVYNISTWGYLGPLDYAAIGNHIEIAKLLIENGATARKNLLRKYKLSEEMKALLKNVKYTKLGSPPNYYHSGTNYPTSLKDAVGNACDGDDKKIEYVNAWIEHDPNLVDQNVLHYAVQHSHPKVVKILFENDAKTQDEDIFEEAMYSHRSEDNTIEKIKILIEYGYGQNKKIRSKALLFILKDTHNRTIPLAIVEYILDLGIDWDYSEIRYQSNIASTYSVIEIILILNYKSVEIMRLLFKKNANVNTILSDGKTMLQRIASSKNITPFEFDLLNLLIEYKANPFIREYKTHATAYQIARLTNNHRVAEKIKQYILEKFPLTNNQDSIEQQDIQLQQASFNQNNIQISIPVQQQNIQSNNPTFTLKKELGEGGYGKVYKGKWQNVTVAIKQTKGPISDKTTNEFLKEANLLKQLRHPNIVQMYDFSTQTGKYSIVMEYVKQGSLYKVLHSEMELNWLIKYNFSLDIIKGLSHLHKKDIIHRDLKSLNILVTKDNSAKLSDFGLAKIKDTAAATSSISTSAVGTPAWMAPELLSIEPIYSFASDIYSLGMVLYEIASRKIPWEGINILAMFIGSREGKRPEIPKETPNSFAQLIADCWTQDRTKRPTADAALTTLEELKDKYKI